MGETTVLHLPAAGALFSSPGSTLQPPESASLDLKDTPKLLDLDQCNATAEQDPPDKERSQYQVRAIVSFCEARGLRGSLVDAKAQDSFGRWHQCRVEVQGYKYNYEKTRVSAVVTPQLLSGMAPERDFLVQLCHIISPLLNGFQHFLQDLKELHAGDSEEDQVEAIHAILRKHVPNSPARHGQESRGKAGRVVDETTVSTRLPGRHCTGDDNHRLRQGPPSNRRRFRGRGRSGNARRAACHGKGKGKGGKGKTDKPAAATNHKDGRRHAPSPQDKFIDAIMRSIMSAS